MAKVTKRAVAPIYAIAVVWLFFAFFRDLYALSHYISAAIVSLVVFLIARGIWPDRTFETADPTPEPEPNAEETAQPEEKTTGDPKIDKLIQEKTRAISEIRRLNDNIEDPGISAQIDQLEATTAKIMDHVIQNPEKFPQIRKFLNYYLPTTLKLLNTYDRMGSVSGAGENVDGTMKKIEDMLDTIVKSFDKQLDSLFRNEAMDISADITVMENMLAQEGLGNNQTM